MNSIAEVTPIILTSEERTELESLARSTKTEYRVRVKARIVLMAADGAATRGIAREVGCAIRIVSKWRTRYARERLAGFVETGNRSAAPKYGPETGRRVLRQVAVAGECF
jgi:Homeodomain-like domain